MIAENNASERQMHVLHNRILFEIIGHTDLPFTLAGITGNIRVDIIPDCWIDCSLSANFIDASNALHEPKAKSCWIGTANGKVELEFTELSEGISSLPVMGITELSRNKRLHVDSNRCSQNIWSNQPNRARYKNKVRLTDETMIL